MIYYDKIFLDELKNKPNFYALISQSSITQLNPAVSDSNIVNDVILPRISQIGGNTNILRRAHTTNIFST